MTVRSQLIATVSSACLVLYASGPIYAQGIADILTDRAEQNVDLIARNTNINAAHQAMLALQSAHTMMTALIKVSKLRDDWQDGEGTFLAIEEYIQQQGTIEYYRHVDGSEPYQRRLHGGQDYNIKYRVCGVGNVNAATGLPERGYQMAVMTILPSLPVAFDNVEELVATAGLHQLQLRDVSLVPNDRRQGTLGRYNFMDNKFYTFDGAEVDVPACLLDTSEWYLESRRFDVNTIAVFELVRPRELNFTHKLMGAAATDTGLCREPWVSADYGVPADAVIGQAQFVRNRVHVSMLGEDNPLTDEGTQINPDNGTPSDLTDDGFIGDWEYVGGCRAPITSEGTLTEACTWTVAGQATDSFRVWRVQQNEIPPARGYYLDGEARTFAPIPGTARFVQGLCDGDPVQPRVTETQATNVETQTGLQCTGSFPDGTWDRQRSYTDTTGRVVNAQPPREWTTRNYDAWVTTRNGCTKTTITSERQTQTVSGCIDQYRDVSVTTVSYASGQAASVTRTDPAWVTSANRCSSGGSGGGNSDRGYYDVNGDGIGDFPTEQAARDYIRKNSGSIHDIDKVDTCDWKCDGSSATKDSSDSNTGDKAEPSTGGGFWSKVKDFFSGGSSSKDSGGGGGGGGSDSCFVRGTLVTMADGSQKKIEEIVPGDVVLDGGIVIVTGQFEPALIYNLGGVHVSGSHLVDHDGKWVPVEDHP